MADRTHEAEDDLTGRTAPTRDGSGKRETPAAPHVYQEGSVDSIGERPTDTDRDDRTGRGPGPARPRAAARAVPRRVHLERGRTDARRAPMQHSKTRG